MAKPLSEKTLAITWKQEVQVIYLQRHIIRKPTARLNDIITQ